MHTNVSCQTPRTLFAIWWPILAGLLILYVPTYIHLANTLWQQSENAHGPIVLIAALWLISRRWRVALKLKPKQGGSVLPGLLLLAFGLTLYVLGRSQDIILFEVGSKIPILLACIWLLSGWQTVKALWFPVMFLIFLVPLPGFIVDALTTPLKFYVSNAVEYLLYAVGYPIGRSGVVLTMGPYQLLVTDACSGLNSMFSLSALGLLYTYLRGHRGWLHNVLLLICILPIAFVANIFRVTALVLITYYAGDAAGQGFMHDFAAITEFFIAMLVLFAIDYLIDHITRWWRHVRT